MSQERKGRDRTLSPLVTALSRAHKVQSADLPRPRKRVIKHVAIYNALRYEAAGIEDEDAHVVLSTPRVEEDTDLQTVDNIIYVVFRGGDNKLRFLDSTRSALTQYIPEQEIDELSAQVIDTRPETSWETQKRLIMHIHGIDMQREKKVVVTDAMPDHLSEKVKNKHVLAYLHTSTDLEKDYDLPYYLFEGQEEGDDVTLIMGQPSEKNLPQRLLNPLAEPILVNGTNDFITQLPGLRAAKMRAVERSQNSADLVAGDIFDILELGL